jgi:hypothetical protein
MKMTQDSAIILTQMVANAIAPLIRLLHFLTWATIDRTKSPSGGGQGPKKIR